MAHTPRHEGDQDELGLPETRRLLQQQVIDIWVEASVTRGGFDAGRLRIQWRSHDDPLAVEPGLTF